MRSPATLPGRGGKEEMGRRRGVLGNGIAREGEWAALGGFNDLGQSLAWRKEQGAGGAAHGSAQWRQARKTWAERKWQNPRLAALEPSGTLSGRACIHPPHPAFCSRDLHSLPRVCGGPALAAAAGAAAAHPPVITFLYTTRTTDTSVRYWVEQQHTGARCRAFSARPALGSAMTSATSPSSVYSHSC